VFQSFLDALPLSGNVEVASPSSTATTTFARLLLPLLQMLLLSLLLISTFPFTATVTANRATSTGAANAIQRSMLIKLYPSSCHTVGT
jgi:hypothetical protein